MKQSCVYEERYFGKMVGMQIDLKMICKDCLSTWLKVVSSCLLQYEPVCVTNFDKLCRINAKNYKFIGLFGISILWHVWRHTWIRLILFVLFALLCVIEIR